MREKDENRMKKKMRTDDKECERHKKVDVKHNSMKTEEWIKAKFRCTSDLNGSRMYARERKYRMDY